MQSGLINKVAITPANLTDAQGLKHVAPNSGAVYADKGYCTKHGKLAAKRKSLHLAAIKNNNMKDKNLDLDCWYSTIRAPYERVFSKQNKRVRYVGIAKNQFSAFMHALCFNLKRLLVIASPNLRLL
jgi:IS5 family transposase